MREIKFRAWDKANKKMYEVIKIDFYNEKVEYLFADPITQGEAIGYFKFSDVELMQYTGFIDKNGVEICEDDIIEYLDGEYSFIGIAQYSPFGWFVKTDEENISFEHFADDTSWKADCRVIGNTYEEQKFKEVENDF